MKQKTARFLAILAVELEDLRDDIQLLAEECEKQSVGDRPNEHVILANLALFRRELIGVDEFNHILTKVNEKKFTTIDELTDYLKKLFDRRARECDLPQAVSICVNRKIDKVAKYFESE